MAGSTGGKLNAFQQGALTISKQRPQQHELVKQYFVKRGVRVK